MSLTTRCPACATMFKVVPDQLRISDGWVRCGRCGEVFDARAQLQPLPAPVSPSVGPDAEAPALPTSGTQEAAFAGEGADATVTDVALEADGREEPDPLPVAVETVPIPPPPPSEPAPEAPVHLLAPEPADAREQVPIAPVPTPEAVEPVLTELTLREPDLRIEPVLDAVANAAPVPEPIHETLPPAEAASAETPEPELSFVRQARRKALWRRPWVRALLTLVALLLASVLALQVTIQERDRLAALEPRLVPWLQALCEPLACRLAPLRQIESVVIDSSAFTKVQGDVFRLGVTLRNQARIPVAMPALELSLTDAQDQPVVRRVLHPADLGAPVVLPAAGEWSITANLTLEAEDQAARIAGYRLIAFYP